MNPFRVASRSDVESFLDSEGYQITDMRTATGTIWVHKRTKVNIQVPDAIEGMYPDVILRDLEARVGKIPRRPLH